MRIMKKAMAMVLSVVMMLAMSVSAVAADGEVTKYKITAPENNHQYEIYQIFTGDYSDGKLTNEKWGANGTGTTGTAVDEDTLTALKNANADGKTYTEKINAIKNCVKSDSAAVATISNGSSYEAVPGYYLIKDITDTTYALYVVQVVGADVTITPKTDQPSFVKKIKDTNDTTGETSEWQDSADYDIGDQVPFKLEGTVTDNYDDYKTYYFAFHDKEEKVKVTDAEGNESDAPVLEFNKDSVKVYVDETLITSGYEVVVDKDKMAETEAADKCTFEIVFKNLKAIKDADDKELVHAGSKIRVTYTSKLTKNAVLGNTGNVNKAKLEFSNKSGDDQNGTGETPWDNVIVFTYKVVVDKYANSVDGEKLTGAEFTLEKVLADSTKKTIDVVKSEDGTSFTFSGLDDGTYILTETKTPDGYNTIDPITFTVSATHIDTWDGGDSDRTGILTDLTGTKETGEIRDITFSGDTSKGEVATKVVNKQGIELPSTGGIGTTIFYVIGGIMVLGAAVVLITKKRMEADK